MLTAQPRIPGQAKAQADPAARGRFGGSGGLEKIGRNAMRKQAEGDERQPDVLHTWLMEANIFGLLAARRWPRGSQSRPCWQPKRPG